MKKKFMLLAIKEAEKNLKRMDGGPFGACIVKGDRVIAVARNTVLKNDATCHAEINAIRLASRKLRTFDLSGCVIYSTTEPCPMCFSAIHWARIDKIIYGTSTKDAKKIGFNELEITDSRLRSLGKSKVKLVPGFMRKECLELFNKFNGLPNKKLY
ncbi:MAG: nucleoside deaminase [Candidatus Omnitrophica bacterium]|nr:nucleoside deaminase [Candidatus Omnitrophota bacterium]MDD5310855.1 nucleoside deaminase [Candidatus Omnitrophota bacterium]MDD5546351.1 nucleoside deaminase [Candidatus Omnitrophota bacterium]